MNDRTKRQSPTDIVRRLSRKELESIVLSQLASENSALASTILARFGDAKGKHEWRSLILQCRDNHSGNSYGIVDDPDGLADDIDELKKNLCQQKAVDSDKDVFDLYVAIVEAIVPDVYEADDHDGVLQEVVNESLEDMLSLANREDTSSSCLSEIREWARANIDAKWAREGYSWDYDLYEVELAAARSRQDFDSSIKLCEAKCTVVKWDDFHQRYLAEHLSQLVCNALEKAGDSTRLQTFIDNHLHLAPVRDTAIRRARDSHNLVNAEILARDGMDLSAQQGYPGIVDHYAMEFISILDEQGKSDAAIEFAVAKTISTYSMNWYKQVMKRIGTAEQKKAITDCILSDVGKRNEFFAAEICVLERRWKELHTLAIKNNSIMGHHYQALGKHYPETVSPWLGKTIRQALRAAQSRSSYRKTAALVSDLQRIGGKSAADLLVHDLVASFSNRPAMIEELRKAL